jgi:hypothetical protein
MSLSLRVTLLCHQSLLCLAVRQCCEPLDFLWTYWKVELILYPTISGTYRQRNIHQSSELVCGVF